MDVLPVDRECAAEQHINMQPSQRSGQGWGWIWCMSTEIEWTARRQGINQVHQSMTCNNEPGEKVAWGNVLCANWKQQLGTTWQFSKLTQDLKKRSVWVHEYYCEGCVCAGQTLSHSVFLKVNRSLRCTRYVHLSLTWGTAMVCVHAQTLSSTYLINIITQIRHKTSDSRTSVH